MGEEVLLGLCCFSGREKVVWSSRIAACIRLKERASDMVGL